MKLPLLKNVCWVQTLFFMMIFCLFIFTLLSGCGTKGDLYIPDRPSNSKIITKG